MHDLCYQCSINGPELLFGNIIITDKDMNHHFQYKIEKNFNQNFYSVIQDERKKLMWIN